MKTKMKRLGKCGKCGARGAVIHDPEDGRNLCQDCLADGAAYESGAYMTEEEGYARRGFRGRSE